MAASDDLVAVRNIRRVLVKHWVDLGRLSVRANAGRALITGSLRRIPGVEDELTTPIVEAMFHEARRLRNVRRVDIHLDNWTKDGGRWRRKEEDVPDNDSGPRLRRRQDAFTELPKVFLVREKTGDSE